MRIIMAKAHVFHSRDYHLLGICHERPTRAEADVPHSIKVIFHDRITMAEAHMHDCTDHLSDHVAPQNMNI